MDPHASFLPAHVAGRLRGRGAEHASDLAVAVNGRIAATTHGVVEGGAAQFEAIVPESSFVAGANRVEVFAVTRAPDGLALLGRSSAATPTLAGGVLRSPGGQRIALVPGAAEGPSTTYATSVTSSTSSAGRPRPAGARPSAS